MMRGRWILPLLCVLVFAPGCLPEAFELRQQITINPDGSGRADIDLRTASTEEVDEKGPEKAARGTAQDFVAKSDGVDAWSDFRYEVLKDGRVHITATAYFKKLSDFSLGDGLPEFGDWEKADDGTRILRVSDSPVLGNGDRPEPATRPARQKKPTAEEIAKAVLAARMEYQSARPRMVLFAALVKYDVTYRLPGPVRDSGALQRVKPRGLRIVCDGPAVLRRFDEFFKNDKLLAEALLRNGNVMTEVMNRTDGDQDMAVWFYFGRRGRPEAKVVGPFQPLFDYAAEVKKAKAAMPAMFKRLGIDPDAAPPNAGIQISPLGEPIWPLKPAPAEGPDKPPSPSPK